MRLRSQEKVQTCKTIGCAGAAVLQARLQISVLSVTCLELDLTVAIVTQMLSLHTPANAGHMPSRACKA